MKSKGKLFLFHWQRQAGAARAAELSAAGWQVEMEFEEGSRGCKKLKTFAPDIAVFDLGEKAVHSRECARALRNARRFRETPFIFVDGSEADVSKVRDRVAAPVFTTGAGLKEVLAKCAP